MTEGLKTMRSGNLLTMIKELNVYDNIRSPQVKDFITIEEWFFLIKESKYSQLIVQARSFGKAHLIYDSVKATLPAITYNFTFRSRKTNDNIVSNTGLLYIDIDDLSFDISILDTSKVFAFYKSYGGLGYSLLVQVDGLNKDNYELTYSSICQDLGLSNYHDKGAKKCTQFNVLSYDPDIFINYNSFIFSSSLSSLIINIDFSTPSIVIKKEKTYTTVEVEKVKDKPIDIRFNNLNEIEVDGEYSVNWEGWDFINCWMPFRRIATGRRNNTLLSYTNNLVWLNPNITISMTENILSRVNNKICEEPVSYAQIKRIVSSIFNYKKDGLLKPIYNFKPRKIVFAKSCGLSREQKLAKCRELLNQKRTNDSINNLYTIIENWDFIKYGKIGQTLIHKNFPISKKTVEKYWFEFKEYVMDLNNQYKYSSNSVLVAVSEDIDIANEVVADGLTCRHETLKLHTSISSPGIIESNDLTFEKGSMKNGFFIELLERELLMI